MKIPFLSALTETVAIDFGTSRTRVWAGKRDVLLDEPTCVAFDERVGKVVAVGQEAIEMVGRVSQNIRIAWPCRAGVIADEEATTALLRTLFEKIFVSMAFWRPNVAVSVSSEALSEHREALVRAITRVGANEVYLVDQCLAAAIGAGVPVADSSGSFLLHAGAGVIEGSVITLGTVAFSRSVPQAGEHFDHLLQEHCRREHHLNISQKTAEKLKKSLSIFPGTTAEAPLLVSGRDRSSGAPKEVYVETTSLTPVAEQALSPVVRIMKAIFSLIPPELTSDVLDKGMLCTGGLSQVKGLEKYVTRHLGVPAFLVDEPEKAVMKGLVQIIENLDEYKQSLAYQG